MNINNPEASRLTELEAVIQENIEGFFKVGHALKEIRESRLYRLKYATFEEYCQKRWDFSRMRASQRIRATETFEALKNINPALLPACEYQIRPLTKLPPQKQVEAWQAVIQTIDETGERLTSALVARVVRDRADTKRAAARKRIRESVAREERYTLAFRQAFSTFMAILWDEQGKEWKNTSREVALKHLNELVNMVKEDNEVEMLHATSPQHDASIEE